MTECRCRRWFAFRLRTLLAVITVSALPLAWAGYSLNWIRQRHAVLSVEGVSVENKGHEKPATSPGCLWLFGEAGVTHLRYGFQLPADLQELRALFPEARLIGGPNAIMPPAGARIVFEEEVP